MNYKRIIIGLVILSGIIPSVIHGQASGLFLAILCLIVGLKLVIDGIQHPKNKL